MQTPCVYLFCVSTMPNARGSELIQHRSFTTKICPTTDSSESGAMGQKTQKQEWQALESGQRLQGRGDFGSGPQLRSRSYMDV